MRKPSLRDRMARPALIVAPLAVIALTAGGCGALQSTESAQSDGAITVRSTDDACEVAVTEAPSGIVSFSVENAGSQVTEFYVLAEDGLQVMGEVENIGPGITRDLIVQLPPGNFTTACKPGMVGDGIRAAFTVTDSGVEIVYSDDIQALVDEATSAYAAYVRDQAEQLLVDTKEFAAAFVAGDDDLARSLYAPARMHWERIEPVAESFGDLDPILDAREADLAEGDEWTGWHRIEKELWPPADGSYAPMTQAEREQFADHLVANTQELYDRTREMTFTIDQLGNGAIELLAEVASGKITGEEEFWSHTDLWDFQANLDGAKVMYATVRPIVEKNDPALAATLDEKFAAVQALLDQVKDGDGWRLYTDLTPEQIKELAAAVDALSEPLSQLTAVLLQQG